MYCHQCGQKLSEDAVFCPSCGTKVLHVGQDNPPFPPSTPAAFPVSSNSPSSEPSPENHPPIEPSFLNQSPGVPIKKKSKKGVIIGVFSGLVIVLISVIFVALNWSFTDYVASVKAMKPFASQDFPYTYGEVFDKYIEEVEWEVSTEETNSDLLATVNISGTAKGTDQEIVISIQISPNPDDPNGLLFLPASATVGDRQFSDQDENMEFLYQLFLAYDQELEDLSSVLHNDGIELTQTFEDEISGITFRYPNDWEPIETFGDFEIASVIDSHNNANSVASMNVMWILDTDPFGVFTADESTVAQEVTDSDATFISLEDAILGDTPAKKLTYQTAGLKGIDTVITYFYKRGDEAYQVTCSFSELTSMKYAPVFEAMMESYQIAPMPEPTPTSTPVPTPFPTPAPDPTDLAMDAYLSIIAQASSYDFSGGYGDSNPPDATYTYALAPVCPECDILGLLLSCYNPSLGTSYIRIFQYDPSSGTVWQPEGIVMIGIRCGLFLMADGNGLYLSTVTAHGDSYVERVTIEDGILNQSTEWSGMVGDNTSPTYLQGETITWYDTYDDSGLQG